ncbi:hypothetical protein FHR83_006799 [Actinoplanes campanulatus]|uniref:Uncharacterized protein n=1 Tax=Actinoplanes campanulatus TaxID=113559 RepID=A0A7W5AMN6_9ACTN|nr:hypothetical protein [Actinoplanes campanulatus]MBB3099093.1 hypothetical protein [Actinoplanes campanulatus]GGN39084.1 hypothetical protein GCM10010109_66600 [Actinoplanes campanulatus]GID40249.1 hypothetical protein Aca09nite_67550 [Actinoplanes campanulatus]
MGYLPLRDTFDLEHAAADIDALVERMAVEYRAGIHEDQCACPGYPVTCKIGAGMEPENDFVIGWLLREGWISLDQIRSATA